MRQLKSLCESKLFQRITGSSLKAIVESAARDSAALLGTVDVNMPLFTLHDERHILNVISWMETLLDVSDIQLGQFEGALCILAAYTHDLGMTLDFAERTALPKDPASSGIAIGTPKNAASSIDSGPKETMAGLV